MSRAYPSIVMLLLLFPSCGEEDQRRTPPVDTGPDLADLQVEPDGEDHGRQDVDADPCEGRPLCTEVGARCQGDLLVSCTLDEDGCLVESSVDCAAVPDGFCDAQADPPACTVEDPCEGVDECAEPGRSCDQDLLVVCQADTRGCLLETRTDCTSVSEFGGECDDTLDPPACVALPDPCESAVDPCEVPSRSCDGDTLVICAEDEFGCLVTTRVNCALQGDFCDPSATPEPACVDPCTLVDLCPAQTYCQGNILFTCEENDDGCLVAVAKHNCLEDRLVCDDDLEVADCVERPCCPEAIEISCGSGIVTANTGDANDPDHPDYTGDVDPPFATNRLDSYECAFGNYHGNELVFEFTHDQPTWVTATATRMGDMGDFDLFALAAGNAICAEEDLLCLAASTGVGTTETVVFHLDPGDYVYLVYDVYDPFSATTQVDLGIGCEICGDGEVTALEQCDDGEAVDGDGCSCRCTVEQDFVCWGQPSHCYPGGDTCEQAIPLEAGSFVFDTTGFTNDYEGFAGNCNISYGGMGPEMVFLIELPGRTILQVSMSDQGWDEFLVLADQCPDISGSCLDYGDDPGYAETFNASILPVDIYIVADSYLREGHGLFSLVVALTEVLCGDGITNGDEECDDGNRVDTDECSNSCELTG